MALAIIQLNTNGIRNPDKRAGLLFVSKRLTVLVTSSVSPGFVLLPFIVLCLLVLKSPVVVSFFFVLVCPLSIFRLMMLVVLCCVSSVFKANCLVLSPCMRPIVTVQGTSFLIKFPLGSIQQCPLSYVAISTQFLITPNIDKVKTREKLPKETWGLGTNPTSNLHSHSFRSLHEIKFTCPFRP